MKPDFRGAVATRDSAKAVLEAIGIQAKYSLALDDQGPKVYVRVGAKDFAAAQTALPFSMGSATVKVIKEGK